MLYLAPSRGFLDTLHLRSHSHAQLRNFCRRHCRLPAMRNVVRSTARVAPFLSTVFAAQRRPLRILGRPSSSSSSSPPPQSYRATAPSAESTSWERGARLVKSSAETGGRYAKEVLDAAGNNPAMHLKTIEDELRGTMGKALGKQGDKILRACACMDEERERHGALIQELEAAELTLDDQWAEGSGDTAAAAAAAKIREKVLESAILHNEHRSRAMQGRWELKVHRQAVGFLVDNHNTVDKYFPIGGALPVVVSGDAKGDGEEGSDDGAGKAATARFGTQLDWWQKIGRWK